MKKKAPFAVLSSTTLVLAMMFAGVGHTAAYADTADTPQHVHTDEIDMTLDSDGDGLKDYFEQSISHSYKADTDGNGVSDAYEDSDGDGLSNLVEQERGLNPTTVDSDGDSVSDRDEIYTYNTDPLKYDTDGDNLSDGTEVLKYNLNPNVADQDGDGILDGMVDRSYSIPTNDFGITGTLTGMGDLPYKLTVRQSPILLVQQMKANTTFDLDSLDPSATFKVSVPLQASNKNDLRLFRYDMNHATLEPVQKQHIDPKTFAIEAEFQGGGSFVVLSMSEYKSSLRPDKANYKGQHKAFKGKAKLVGLPGVEVDGADIAADGTFTITKDTVSSYDGKSEQLKATYKVNEMQVSDGITYLTPTALTTESGLQPTILIHGLNSDSTCWGFNNKWSNGSSPSAESAIASTQTFSGTSYASGYTSNFGNPDVQYITSVSDSAEMGPILDINKGYTPNRDLFIFEYDANGHVSTAASNLKNFIANLRAKGIIASTQNVNLMGHSKGGLVSRYYIENLSGSANVTRLVTLGTPHYGSDWATFGDLDRDDSALWWGTKPDGYCTTFTNSHPYTKYFAFGGFNASAGDINATSPSQRGVWQVGQLSGSYDSDVRNRFAAAGNGISWFSYADIEDGWVNIDSAMGSDKEPDYSGTLPTLSFKERWYVIHETYGAHSPMRKYSLVQNLVSDMLKGLRDL